MTPYAGLLLFVNKTPLISLTRLSIAGAVAEGTWWFLPGKLSGTLFLGEHKFDGIKFEQLQAARRVKPRDGLNKKWNSSKGAIKLLGAILIVWNATRRA